MSNFGEDGHPRNRDERACCRNQCFDHSTELGHDRRCHGLSLLTVMELLNENTFSDDGIRLSSFFVE